MKEGLGFHGDGVFILCGSFLLLRLFALCVILVNVWFWGFFLFIFLVVGNSVSVEPKEYVFRILDTGLGVTEFVGFFLVMVVVFSWGLP